MNKSTTCYNLQNEESNITSTLDSVCGIKNCEVLVIDGGSSDNTVQLASRTSARVIHSPQQGRAFQMNVGADSAQGDILLFLHGDSKLPHRWEEDVCSAVSPTPSTTTSSDSSSTSKQQKQWGCFSTIEARDTDYFTRLFLYTTVSLRTWLFQRPYGDQALFVKRHAFQSVGKYPSTWPLLEDVDLVCRLKRKYGRGAIIARPVQTSGRRWQKMGLVKTTVLNQMILVGHALGVDVETLAGWYKKPLAVGASRSTKKIK